MGLPFTGLSAEFKTKLRLFSLLLRLIFRFIQGSYGLIRVSYRVCLMWPGFGSVFFFE